MEPPFSCWMRFFLSSTRFLLDFRSVTFVVYLGYHTQTPWPVCNVCFGHWILHVVSSRVLYRPGSWSIPMAPRHWRQLHECAHRNGWDLDPGKDTRPRRGKDKLANRGFTDFIYFESTLLTVRERALTPKPAHDNIEMIQFIRYTPLFESFQKDKNKKIMMPL